MSEDEPYPPYERIAEFLQSELGGDLRVVSYISPKSEQVPYMREDLQAQYTRDELREVLYEILMDVTDRGTFEQSLESDMEATTMIFEDRVITVLLTDVQEAIVISLDRDGDYSYLNLVDACQSLLE